MPIATITIGAGESLWVPKNATILSVDATDGLVLQGEGCIDTTVAPRVCWKFSWEGFEVGAEYVDAVFTGIEIKNIVYDFNPTLTQKTYNDPDDLQLEIPRVVTFSIMESFSNTPDVKTIIISLPESMGRPLLLWTNTNGTDPQYSAMVGQSVTCPEPV